MKLREENTESAYETKFWVLDLMSHVKDRLIPRRMQFTASRYLFLFQSYNCLKIPNQRHLKGSGNKNL